MIFFLYRYLKPGCFLVCSLFLISGLNAGSIELRVGEEKDVKLANTAKRINISKKGVADLFMPEPTVLALRGVNPGVTLLVIEYDNHQFEELGVVVSPSQATPTESILKYLKSEFSSFDGLMYRVELASDKTKTDKIIISGNARPRDEGYIRRIIGLFPEIIQLKIIFTDQRDIDLASYLKQSFKNLPGVIIAIKNSKVSISGKITEQDRKFYDEVTKSFKGDLVSTVEIVPDESIPTSEAQPKELPTVQVDIQVVEVNLSKAREMGIRWFPGGVPIRASSTVSGSGDITDPKHISTTFAYGISGLDIEFKALIESGVGSILATPKLKVRSGSTASFVVGGEVPVISTTANFSTVEYKEFGTQLNITPNVREDGQIDVLVKATVSTLDFSRAEQAQGNPLFNKKEAETDLTIHDGLSFALAGLIERQKSYSIAKVPVLGSIPLLGRLFKKTTELYTDTETLIIVTPHIISGEDVDGYSYSQPRIGTDQIECERVSLSIPELSSNCYFSGNCSNKKKSKTPKNCR